MEKKQTFQYSCRPNLGIGREISRLFRAKKSSHGAATQMTVFSVFYTFSTEREKSSMADNLNTKEIDAITLLGPFLLSTSMYLGTVYLNIELWNWNEVPTEFRTKTLADWAKTILIIINDRNWDGFVSDPEWDDRVWFRVRFSFQSLSIVVFMI